MTIMRTTITRYIGETYYQIPTTSYEQVETIDAACHKLALGFDVDEAREALRVHAGIRLP
jgi:hypothetical protein